MLFVGLLVFLVLWWPVRVVVLRELPVSGAWMEILAAGAFYLVCLSIGWVADRFPGNAAEEQRRVLTRVVRAVGTGWMSFLMFAVGGATVAAWFLGVEVARWYLGVAVVVGGCGLRGLFGGKSRGAASDRNAYEIPHFGRANDTNGVTIVGGREDRMTATSGRSPRMKE